MWSPETFETLKYCENEANELIKFYPHFLNINTLYKYKDVTDFLFLNS